jgi:hypothetical protein
MPELEDSGTNNQTGHVRLKRARLTSDLQGCLFLGLLALQIWGERLTPALWLVGWAVLVAFWGFLAGCRLTRSLVMLAAFATVLVIVVLSEGRMPHKLVFACALGFGATLAGYGLGWTLHKLKPLEQRREEELPK